MMADSNHATMIVANAHPTVRRAATKTSPSATAVPMAAMTSNVEPGVGRTRNTSLLGGLARSAAATGLQ